MQPRCSLTTGVFTCFYFHQECPKNQLAFIRKFDTRILPTEHRVLARMEREYPLTGRRMAGRWPAISAGNKLHLLVFVTFTGVCVTLVFVTANQSSNPCSARRRQLDYQYIPWTPTPSTILLTDWHLYSDTFLVFDIRLQMWVRK